MADTINFETYKHYVHKEVSCRYLQENLTFSLSQELFSSFDIDTGTRHLLSLLEKRKGLSSLRTVLDIGSGTGVIASAAAKAASHLDVYAIDRDALACAFTAGNAAVNGVTVHVSPGLDGIPEKKDFPNEYDLIISNIPAKAGKPVLRRLISNSLAQLTPGGSLACVIVSPLKQILISIIEELGGVIDTLEHHQRHPTFIITKGEGDLSLDASFPGPYKRTDGRFPVPSSKHTYPAETVFDVPGFDTVPFQVSLLSSVIPESSMQGNHFFWNTGQGHLPMQMLHAYSGTSPIRHAIVAGRDLLSLKITKHNIGTLFPELPVQLIHSPDIPSAAEQIACGALRGIWMDLEGSFLPLRSADLSACTAFQLEQDGILGITGKSSVLSSLPKRVEGFTRKRTKKSKGFRTVLLSPNLP